jgi:hypothetical protein
MKIYAKQVAPEMQESPLFLFSDLAECVPAGVYVFGNRDYKGVNAAAIDELQNVLYDAAEDLKSMTRGEYPGPRTKNDFYALLWYHFPTENGRKYSRADRLKWRDLLLDFDAGAVTEDDATRAALELITGDEYDDATIRGCCQGDWMRVLYPAALGREWLDIFECEYFNTGDEWRLSFDDPDGDENEYIYTHSWNDDEKRAEIAREYGAQPGDVVLYAFDGWSREPIYKEVI